MCPKGGDFSEVAPASAIVKNSLYENRLYVTFTPLTLLDWPLTTFQIGIVHVLRIDIATDWSRLPGICLSVPRCPWVTPTLPMTPTMTSGAPHVLDGIVPSGPPAALADIPPEVVARIEHELEIRGENVTLVELEQILRGCVRLCCLFCCRRCNRTPSARISLKTGYRYS